MSSFDEFLKKFVESFSGKDPMIFNVLGNVFSMRIIGNKTHGVSMKRFIGIKI